MIPYFINPHQFRIAVPNAMGSTTIVPPGGLVKGTYYTELSLVGLLDEYNGVVDPLNVYYTYPEPDGGSGSSTSGIADILAGDGIDVSIVGDTATISLSPGSIDSSFIANGAIQAVHIASGQVVKLLNTFTDTVLIEAGSGIAVDNDTGTITVSSTVQGLDSVDATAPLVLSLDAQVLSGSIAITATDNGGAVALQPTLPVTYQIGHVGLEGNFYLSDGFVRLNSSDDATVVADPFSQFLSFYNSGFTYAYAHINGGSAYTLPSTDLVFSVGQDGTLNTFDVNTYGKLHIRSISTGTPDVFKVTNDIGATNVSSIEAFSPAFFYDTVTLSQDGYITGAVTTEKLISLFTNSDTVAAISVQNDIDGTAAIALETLDENDNVTAQLDTLGNFTSSTVRTGLLATNNIVRPPVFLTTGSYAVENYDEKVFILDSSAGAITISLPELTVGGDIESGTVFTFSKYDSTSNGILLAPQNGQLVNGQSNLSLATQGQFYNIMAVIISSPSPSTFWITV